MEMGPPYGYVPTVFVRLTIKDGVLVRRGLKVTGVTQDHYDAEKQLGPILFKRGWIMVDAQVRGVPYHFLNTHLEIQPFADVQLEQTQELLNEVVPDLDGVTVLMGDFNSNAAGVPGGVDPSWTSTHDDIVAEGFQDAWSLLEPDETPEGLTCCQADDLRNPDTQFYQRIDFIFFKAVDRRGNEGVPPEFLAVEIVGEEQGDRTYPSGMWPSDHAGVVADMWWIPGQLKREGR
jgi:endonuclease/exonuclease/phosphatase family metal-dependent hydrolase